MKDPGEPNGMGGPFMPFLERLPVLSHYAKTRGWHYVISWLHRLTGIWLFIALIFHVYAFSAMQATDFYPTRVKGIIPPVLILLAWASSLAVGLHAFNGGRILLYELFGRRNDAKMIQWTFGLSVAFAAVVCLMAGMNNLRVSPPFLWLAASFSGGVAACAVCVRLWKKHHSVFWTLQRISGAFLFISVPVYLLFLFLNQGGAVETQDVITRPVFLLLATGALYHAGYGLFSIAADYVSPGVLRTGLTGCIVAVVAMLAVMTFRFLFSI